ncbi:hypothetical protein [Vagococcus martis]
MMNDLEEVKIICERYLKKLKIKLHEKSFNKCLEFYYTLFFKNNERQKIVLDAKPGHGKTTALYCFVNYIINYTDEPLLLVFKEKQQQKDLKIVLRKLNEENFCNQMYFDWNSSNQYNETEELYESQVLSITHSRLEKLLIFKQYGINLTDEKYESKTLEYKGNERKIIIDEEPSMFIYNDFTVNDLPWLDEEIEKTKFGYKEEKKKYVYDKVTKGNLVNSKEKLSKAKMYFRCIIPFLIASEHLDNTSTKTKCIQRHNNERGKTLFELFFSEVKEKIEAKRIKDMEFIKKFVLLRELYYKDGVGFFTPEQKNNPRGIVVSQKINYDLISNSILIMDGTSSYFEMKYLNFGFELVSIENVTNYKRVSISIRNINTTSAKRSEKKTKKKKTTQEEIVFDVKELKSKHDNIFFLCSKGEIDKYKEVDEALIIPEIHYPTNYKDDLLLLHIFNTRGKNLLNKQTSLYLSSLPIKPPNYYRALAFLLYKNESLNYRMKKKNKKENWFSDKRIEEIYENDLLCELVQIFFRTDLRNLKSVQKIYFFIASQSIGLLTRILKRAEFKNISSNLNEPNIKQKEKMTEIVKVITLFFDTNQDVEKTTLGRISIDGRASNYLANYFNMLIKNNHLSYMNGLLKKNKLCFFIEESNSYKKIKRL